MPLPTGEKLGPYEILGLIGTGGMGEVYRARDPRLGRDVAIKVSAERFTERFEREARVIASLNHPNICTLHDVGPNYLVMELVEGPTLAERIQQGAIPFDEAVRIARQIADALEAAHDKGIVHRDLKPGNIKIKPDGIVKVLDFGLAKLGGIAAAVSDSSPTMTRGETEAGVILGTAAYMPPEQAKGREVDKRADIWAFGVVLHEMLTGKRLFHGETTTETLAAVIERAPRWDNVPAQARPLLRRCLEKDPKRRLRDIGEAMVWLESPPEPVPAPATARTRWLWPAIAAILLAATALLGFLYLRPKPSAAPEIARFEIAQPPNVAFTDSFAVSPDGRKLAFTASTSGNFNQLWVRFMDTLQARPLPGTDVAGGTPFWSPDSRYIVFFAQGKLQKIEATGGPAQTLCGGLTDPIRGGFWTSDNKIIFSTNSLNGLWQVSAAGGACSPFTALTSGENRHLFPTLLPDGRHFVFARSQSTTIGGIYLSSLDAKPNDPASTKLLPDISATAYVPSINSSTVGYLLFVRGGTLMAQSFDNQRLELEGEAVPIAEHIPASGLSASATGILVYRNGSIAAADRLTWFDRKGKELGVVGDPAVFEINSPPALSPDGKRAAFARTDSQSGNTDIWLFEFARGVSSRFTFDPGQDINPVWSPDSARIAFAGERNGVWGIYQKASNLAGGEELLYKSGNLPARPATWSRDGRFLLYSAGSPYDIGLIPMNTPASSGADLKAREILHTQFNERGARLSPDGRFFAYVSNSSGKDEVYVQTFDASSSGPAGGTVMVSKDGGTSARWRGDGREIFYNTPDGNIMSVDVSNTPVFQASVPKVVFRPPASPGLFWDVTSDGQRFLLVVAASPASSTPYTVVQNWQAALRK